MSTKRFQDLIVWQRARDLAVEVYQLTEHFPPEERFGLSNQMRRASISISSNIAESYHKRSAREKRQYLSIAYGSAAELESQLEVAKVLFPVPRYQNAKNVVVEISKMLNVMLQQEVD